MEHHMYIFTIDRNITWWRDGVKIIFGRGALPRCVIFGPRGLDDGHRQRTRCLCCVAVVLYVLHRIVLVLDTVGFVLTHSRKTRPPSRVIRTRSVRVVRAAHRDVAIFLVTKAVTYKIIETVSYLRVYMPFIMDNIYLRWNWTFKKNHKRLMKSCYMKNSGVFWYEFTFHFRVFKPNFI